MRRNSLIIFIAINVTGCASTSFEDLGKQLDSRFSRVGGQDQSNTANATYGLTIQAEPSDSTVKIMNIKPKYYDGIQLKSGAYDLLVQRVGYKSHREWVSISNFNLRRNVVLSAVAQKNASQSSPTTTQAITKSQVTEDIAVDTVASTASETKPTRTPKVAKVPEATKRGEPVKKLAKTPTKKVVEKAGETKAKAISNEKYRADYRPPEIAKPSELTPAEITEEQQPKFNGAYIKAIDEGFFSDTVQLIEMEQKPAYSAKMFRMKPNSNVGITWLLKQKKKYFALENLKGTVTLPIEQFKGIIFKGKSAEYVTLHRAERWVSSYDEDGTKKGASAKFFDSNYGVPEGGAVYVPMDEENPNKSKISDDSYFIDFKQPPEKGLYICWVESHFWFFNLI